MIRALKHASTGENPAAGLVSGARPGVASAPMDVDLLRTVSILRHLTDDELRAVCALLTRRDVKPRERIIEEGTEVKILYIVCSGVVHIRRLAQKREMLLGRLGVGGFFGEINLFDPGVATASIYAMKPTVLAFVDYETLRTFMSEHPATGYKIVTAMMTEVARRFRLTSARLVNTAYWKSAEAGAPPRE